MRALIVSDIHANIDALIALDAELRAASETFDMVLALGDFVDYGAAPSEVIAWARANVRYAVRGNHDHAMATGADCRSAPAVKDLSVATRDFFRPRLSKAETEYLGALPVTQSLSVEGRNIEMVHATPRNPLFEYLSADAEEPVWRDALADLADKADFLLIGHTHLPFTKMVGQTLVVNPGSLGLPIDGDPRGCYAVLDGDRVELRRIAYDVERAVERLETLGLDPGHLSRLVAGLRGQANNSRGS